MAKAVCFDIFLKEGEKESNPPNQANIKYQGQTHFSLSIGQPPKAAVLMVGDSLTSDIRGGVDYGIDTCWFNPQGKAVSSDCQPTYDPAEELIVIRPGPGNTSGR